MELLAGRIAAGVAPHLRITWRGRVVLAATAMVGLVVTAAAVLGGAGALR